MPAQSSDWLEFWTRVLTWVAQILAIGGVLVHLIKRYFSTVTRSELQVTIHQLEQARERRHQERIAAEDRRHNDNLAWLRRMDERLGEVEQTVAGVQGEIKHLSQRP